MSPSLWDWGWFLFWALSSSAWCWTTARDIGATFDEPVYVARGLEGWRAGSHYDLLRLGTMPLPIDVTTLPICLWEKARGVPLDPVGDLDHLLPWARAGTLIFWWLLLFYGRLAGRKIAGPWAGCLSVAFLACEPALLAHASLATTDIAISACLLALVYHFRTSREAGWGRRIAIPAAWFAAAVLSKASGLVFGPICLFVLELERLAAQSKARHLGETWCLAGRAFVRDSLQIVMIGIVLVFLYCGCDWKTEPSFVAWAQRLPDSPSSRAVVWLAEHLRVFSNAGEGIVRQIRHNVRGHGVFLLGHAEARAIWYYFPVALTIKLSLPLLFLPLLVAICRPRALVNWAILCFLALLLFSLTCRVQIGIRLVLPMVVLGIVGLAAALARWRTEDGEAVAVSPYRRVAASSRLRVALSSLFVIGSLMWTAAAALAVRPHGLCYTNKLWGGTDKGYLRLSDSNYDWGQGLRELASWQKAYSGPALDVWYFGTDPAIKTLPFRELPLHVLPIQKPGDVSSLVKGHYLAVSTSLLYGRATDTEPYYHALAFLRRYEPMARTTTFFIYDFTKGEGEGQGREMGPKNTGTRAAPLGLPHSARP